MDFKDRLALSSIRLIRSVFDKVSGYNEKKMTEEQWLTRCIFLETVAGVPGMVGGMSLHLKSLRSLRPDHGLVHHLLEEAENERTHLFIFLQLK
jgi:threonyl-tRNA synthetase